MSGIQIPVIFYLSLDSNVCKIKKPCDCIKYVFILQVIEDPIIQSSDPGCMWCSA